VTVPSEEVEYSHNLFRGNWFPVERLLLT